MKVTRQAIVNKMRRAGISFNELSSGKQGKAWILTEEGAARIRDLMKKSTAQNAEDGQEDNRAEMRRTMEEQKARIEEQQKTIEEQQARIEELTEETNRRKAEIE